MIKITLQKSLAMAGGQKLLLVDMQIAEGDFVVIFGKSGTGKTSLLKMIAGIMHPEHGQIEVNNEVWFDAQKSVLLPTQQRNLGFVFQDLALFPNMTVMEHLQFAAAKDKDRPYLDRLLAVTDLGTFTTRKPQSLSGGQQQRLAIIRALARKPKLLLLDEPFSALDQQMGLHLRQHLKLLQAEFQFTTLLVSHEAIDIYGKSDKLIEIKDGKAILHQPLENKEDNNNNNNNNNNFTGKISRIYAYERNYIVEITLGQETLKIPVDESTAKSLQINTTVSVTFNNDNLRLSSSEGSY